ncbi:MAG: rRNA maturation RNase YbeY [Defluviitaleaceae bacterium]|nr:rRNA maturation RNase YbeY [Defluviitaleaceae bacterium]
MISVINETGTPLTPEQEGLIKKIVKIALEQENKTPNATVDITVVSDEKIRLLNYSYRGIDKVTDVLSFPMTNYDLGEKVPRAGEYILGDIVFSYDMAVLQSKCYGHSLEREIGFFVAHSMLHLLGYDHNNEDNERKMLRKQESILKAANLER